MGDLRGRGLKVQKTTDIETSPWWHYPRLKILWLKADVGDGSDDDSGAQMTVQLTDF